MYDYENSTQNPDGAASGSGSNTDSGAGAGISAGSGGEYRYSGPFYQDDLSGAGSGSTGSRASSGYSYSYESGGYSGGSYRNAGEVPPKKKKKKGFGKTLAKTVCIALVFGIVAGAAFQGTNYLGRQIFGDEVTVSGSESTAVVPEISTVTPQPYTGGDTASGMSVASIVDQCMPSLVAITNVSVREVQNFWGWGWYSMPQEQEEVSTGTGIIIGQNDSELLIVTNNHVISGATELTVLFSVDEGNDEASAVEAQIKGTDATKDVGVIAVPLDEIPAETMSQIKAASIGDSSALKVGDQVVAIGNALGYGQSVTTGIVSALDREVSLQNDDGTVINNKLIQTDAAINPGNSGGALLNMQGQVVGINEAKLSSSYVEGMGYAIPISDVEGIIGDLKSLETRSEVDEENRGYLGVTCQDVTQDVSEMYDMPAGVYLKSIVPNCAADRAGLHKGDIITKFGGVSISSYEALQERLQYYEAGETVEVTVQSPGDGGYTEKTVDVTLSSMEEVEKNQ